MNLISQAFSGAITWAAAEARIIAAEAAVVGKGILARGVSDVKQDASDAIGQADSVIAANYANVAKAAETALEAELALLTRGISTPLNPLISKGIDDLADAAVKAAHAWALAAKAKLAETNVNVGPAQLQGNVNPQSMGSVNGQSMGGVGVNMPGAAGQTVTLPPKVSGDSRD